MGIKKLLASFAVACLALTACSPDAQPPAPQRGLNGTVTVPPSLLPAQANTTITIFAARLKPGADPNLSSSYDGSDPQAGQAEVTLRGNQGSVSYGVVNNLGGQPLQPGTYRVVACVNKNQDATVCNAGDLGGTSRSGIRFDGDPVTGVNVTLAQL